MLHQFKTCRQLTNHPIVCDETDIVKQTINYTHQNPINASIITNAKDCSFSSVRDYAGEKDLISVEFI